MAVSVTQTGSRVKVSLTVSGTSEFALNMAMLKDAVRNRALRQAMRSLGSVGNKAARAALSRRRTGQLKKSIGFVVRRYRKGDLYAVLVGPQKGFATTVKLPARKRGLFGRIARRLGRRGYQDEMKVDPVKYAHLVEGGRKAVAAPPGKLLRIVTARRGRVGVRFAARAAAVQGTPFIGPAAVALEAVAAAELEARFWAKVGKIAAQQARRGQSIYRG